MSYSIATALKIKNNEVLLSVGCNNVKPFYSSPTKYEDNDFFMQDLLSGGLQIDRLNTKIAKKVKEAIEKVKKLHYAGYGLMQDKYMFGYHSINPYSLYMIAQVYNSDRWGKKEEFLNNAKDLKYVSKDYHTEKLVEWAIYSTKWDEYVEFYKLLLTIFKKEIGLES